MSVMTALLKTMGMASYPYEVGVYIRSLIEDISFSPEKKEQIRRRYLKKFTRIGQETICKEVGIYLWHIIDALYEKDKERRKQDVSKLLIDEKPESVELTAKERTAVTALLIDICRKLCGNIPLSMLGVRSGVLIRKGGDEMAISEALNPYEEILADLVKDVVLADLVKDVSSSLQISDQIQKEYSKRLYEIVRQECLKEVGNYLGCIIYTLYAEAEEQRKLDVTRLVIGGQVDSVEITAEQRAAVASLFVDKCRQSYGDTPIKIGVDIRKDGKMRWRL